MGEDMKKAPLKSGGFVNILEEGEAAIPGEVNFTGKELAWARKISVSTNDPEAEKEFWKNVIEKKKADENYSVFTDFPEVGSECLPDPNPTAKHPSADDARVKDSKRRAFPGEAICAEILETLKGRGAKTRREREEAV